MLPEQRQVKQIGHPQAAASHLIFISGADAAGSRADLYAAGRILRRQLDHAMVRKNHVRAVRDEKIAINFDARIAQRRHFF